MLSLLIDWFHTFLLLDSINPNFRSEAVTLENKESHGMLEDRKTLTKELEGWRSQREMRTAILSASGTGGLCFSQ